MSINRVLDEDAELVEPENMWPREKSTSNSYMVSEPINFVIEPEGKIIEKKRTYIDDKTFYVNDMEFTSYNDRMIVENLGIAEDNRSASGKPIM